MRDDDPLTSRIIGCACLVASVFGSGFLEKVCLLMNFGRPKLELRRLMMDQGNKGMEPVMNGDGQ